MDDQQTPAPRSQPRSEPGTVDPAEWDSPAASEELALAPEVTPAIDVPAHTAARALRGGLARLHSLAGGDRPPLAPPPVTGVETAEAPFRAPRFGAPTAGEEPPPAPPLGAPRTVTLFDELPPVPDGEPPDTPAEPAAPWRIPWPEIPALPPLPFRWTAHIAVLTAVATLTFLVFLVVEPTPRWLLLVGAGAVVAGMDGTLRATWREPFASGADTTPYLFLPALYTFAAPILIEHNASGYAVIPWALVAGAGFAAVAVAEVSSVRFGAALYPYARLVAAGATYFVAFTLFAMTYVLHPGLPAALVATWLVCVMLGIELLREGEVDPLETLLFAAVAGLVVAQARWLIFFLPVDGYLAGLALLLAFFLAIGLLHAYVMRQLTAVVAAEYIAIASLGLALVIAARAAGIA